jgi:hypothetical protein
MKARESPRGNASASCFETHRYAMLLSMRILSGVRAIGRYHTSFASAVYSAEQKPPPW